MKRFTTLLIFLSIFSSCNKTHSLKSETMAVQACECFGQQTTGTIDERLDPCLAKPINENINEIHKFYDTDKPVEVAMKNYMMDVMVKMISDCDKFFNEMDLMYTNFYPQLDKQQIVGQLSQIQDSLVSDNLTDSLAVRLLHKRIALLTRARDFENAISDIQTLGTKFGRQSEVYLVTAYIFRAQMKYDEALIELDKAIEAGNKDYILFKELVKRRKKQQHSTD